MERARARFDAAAHPQERQAALDQLIATMDHAAQNAPTAPIRAQMLASLGHLYNDIARDHRLAVRHWELASAAKRSVWRLVYRCRRR